MTAWLSPSHTDHHDLSLSLPHTALRQHCASKCFPDTVQALACTALSQGSVPLNSTAAACCAGSLQPQLEINTEAHTQSTNYMGKCSWECQRGFWNRGCFAAAAVSTVGRGAQRDRHKEHSAKLPAEYKEPISQLQQKLEDSEFAKISADRSHHQEAGVPTFTCCLWDILTGAEHPGESLVHLRWGSCSMARETWNW
eukprot:3071213-Rhodomonas_salina.1